LLFIGSVKYFGWGLIFMLTEFETAHQAFRAYSSLHNEPVPFTESQNQDALIFVLHTKHIYMILSTGEEMTLGRQHATNAIQPDLDLSPYEAELAGISRRHATLRHEKIGWWLIDLNSSNGTWVNSERLAPLVPQMLSRTNHVILGNLKLTLVLPEDASVICL
jgi:FHA domain